MRRGEVWWADLPDPTGSEPGFSLPVVVIQSDRFNVTKLNTVIIAAVTGNARLAALPGNVLLRAGSAGLPRESVINITQLAAIDQGRLVRRSGRLSAAKMRELEHGLRLVLAL